MVFPGLLKRELRSTGSFAAEQTTSPAAEMSTPGGPGERTVVIWKAECQERKRGLALHLNRHAESDPDAARFVGIYAFVRVLLARTGRAGAGPRSSRPDSRKPEGTHPSQTLTIGTGLRSPSRRKLHIDIFSLNYY